MEKKEQKEKNKKKRTERKERKERNGKKGTERKERIGLQKRRRIEIGLSKLRFL
ncbi:hypothetical protein RhiirA5_436471 [Rhizophagus irregularis]|uniref:Uncharacterized protein n=1 Tax=Rhizophagus irregularis TaxID=588596 RepID=A0A2I1FJW7_9GLOM|nr:hypothetical protein RhiirA5_436471 [Rhizophagus irregularis]PKC53842.1 hypothetical protein RhiirA1_478467 [Rhizophagus irregularis]PKY34670.1 hypothetical protein RhiirB3_454617 [Rhizophagus irregularis]